MAVLFNETSLGWRSQSMGTFLMSFQGDTIKEFQQHNFVNYFRALRGHRGAEFRWTPGGIERTLEKDVTG
jgi:hypothetical protein